MANYCTPMIASGAGSTLGYVEEACYGIVPDAPVVKKARRRSTTVGLKKDSYTSEEIRSDRMVSSARHGMRRSEGDIVTEISSGAHADFYEALMGGNWEQPSGNVDLTGATVVKAQQNSQITISGLADDPHVIDGTLIGDVVRITGTTDPFFDGRLFLVIATATASMTLLEQLITATTPANPTSPIVSGNAKVQPRCNIGNIYRSFTFERAFDDIGSFLVTTGNRINTAAIDLPATGIATCTFGVLGQNAKPLSSASIDGTTALVMTDTTFGVLTGDAATKTLTATTGSFITAGVEVGDKLILDGGGSANFQNRALRTVTKVTALVLTVAEAVRTGSTTASWTMTRLGTSDYDEGATNNVLVAATGAVSINGKAVGTVTALTLNIDNQMAGAPTVGSDVVTSILWGNQAAISGNVTVLFDRGGMGEELYNSFANETAASISVSLVNAEGTRCVGFTLPNCKINTGDIGDAVAEGLPVSCDFVALKPSTVSSRPGVSALRITDTEVPNPAPVSFSSMGFPNAAAFAAAGSPGAKEKGAPAAKSPAPAASAKAASKTEAKVAVAAA